MTPVFEAAELRKRFTLPLLGESVSYVRRILLFLFYSYVESPLDNDIWIPIYKTIPAIGFWRLRESWPFRHIEKKGDFFD